MAKSKIMWQEELHEWINEEKNWNKSSSNIAEFADQRSKFHVQFD